MSAKAYRQKKLRRLFLLPGGRSTSFCSVQQDYNTNILPCQDSGHHQACQISVKDERGHEKTCTIFMIHVLSGAPRGTRTLDLLIRSQTLYPAELVALIQFVVSYCLVTTNIYYHSFAQLSSIFFKFQQKYPFISCSRSQRSSLPRAKHAKDRAFILQNNQIGIHSRQNLPFAFRQSHPIGSIYRKEGQRLFQRHTAADQRLQLFQ